MASRILPTIRECSKTNLTSNDIRDSHIYEKINGLPYGHIRSIIIAKGNVFEGITAKW